MCQGDQSTWGKVKGQKSQGLSLQNWDRGKRNRLLALGVHSFVLSFMHSFNQVYMNELLNQQVFTQGTA